MKPFEQFILWIKIILLFIFLPLILKAQSNQTVNAGGQTAAVNFPVTTCTYQWTNSNPLIGLPISGSGDITPFTAINNTTLPITATIFATPVGPQTQPPLLYIPNSVDNTVSVINATTNILITTVNVGINPVGVVVSRDYNRVYIANQGDGTVSVIYMPTNRVIATIPGFSTPGSMAVSPDNQKVYVANPGSNTVSVINALNNTIGSTIQVGPNPSGLSLSFDGSKLYTSNSDGTISVVNTTTNTVTTIGPIASSAFLTALSPDDSKLYVAKPSTNEIAVINTSTNLVVDNINVGSPIRNMSISPDGSRLYIANPVGNNIIVMNTATKTIITTISAGISPAGLSVSDDGSLLFVSNSGSNSVSVINANSLTITQTVSVGRNPVAIGKFYLMRADCGQTITLNITVNPVAGPTITTAGTPSVVNTDYGTPSTSSSFMVSGSDIGSGILVTPPPAFELSLDGTNYTNTVTISGAGSIASTRVYIRLKRTTNAGTYSGNIVLTSAGAASVNVVMPPSTVSPLAVVINTVGNIKYGITVSDFHATTSNFDFSVINAMLKNGETASSMDIHILGGANGTDPVGTYPNAVISSNLQGANGFFPGNYSISYTAGNIVRYPSPITIRADNVTKVAGTTLTGSSGSIAFSYTALENGESVTSVTIAYGNGAAANAAVGTYTGSVIASALTGTNGFLASNYAITYLPGNIVVTAAPPVITTTGTLQALTTVYGTPSLPASFTVSATDLTTGILITPPTGFEVSTDNSVYSPTVTVGSTGNLSSTTIYIRLKQTSFVNTYSGNITLQTSGTGAVTKFMPNSTVTQAPLTITAHNFSKTYGDVLTGSAGSNAYSISGLQNGETTASVTIAYGAGATAASAVGVYSASIIPSAITGGTFTLANYSPVYQNGTIVVSPATLTVTADNKTKFYGDVNPAFTVTYSGFVNGEGATQLTTQPTASTTATQASLIGQYPITPSGGASTNYAFTYVNGVLTVTAVPLGPVSIPNTFTPNGDGINDIWNIANLDTYPKITVTIFNRNGTPVYFSNGYPTPWDGNYNGSKVPLGTYYYVITGVNNKPLTGYVAVIR